MYLGVDYFPFDATESIVLGIDFVNDLASGDTIASATSLTCTVALDSQVPDASASTRIVAGPTVVPTTVVTFKFGNSPVAGCKYVITITILSAGGDTITDYTHVVCEVPL